MSDDGAGGDRRDDGGDVSRGGTTAPLSVGSGATLGGGAASDGRDGRGGDSRQGACTGRAGLGHRLVAVWARVRAAFGDG